MQAINAQEKHLDKNYSFLVEDEDCDTCGCSANGGSLGFSSLMQQNFVGIRYFYQKYSTLDGVYRDSPWIDQYFRTTQIWAKLPLGSQFEISALVPYHNHTSHNEEGTRNIRGIGDITLNGIYKIIQTNNIEGFNHKLDVGLGVKLPTGSFDDTHGKTEVNPGYQVGTGSFDGLALIEYIIEHSSSGFGLQNNVSYTYKTKNKAEYRFGNQFSYATALYYKYNKGDFSIIPQLGINGEVFGRNTQYENIPIYDTEGNALFSRLGIDFGYKKFNFGFNGLLPVYQNLTGGKVKAEYRLSFHLNYRI